MSEELRQQMVEELTGQHVRPDFAGLLTRRGAEWLADTLLSGPLAPLLAALSTKQHNHTRFTNDSGATWSRCPASCPVALRRALDGTP